jgi:hypothetical protein
MYTFCCDDAPFIPYARNLMKVSYVEDKEGGTKQKVSSSTRPYH